MKEKIQFILFALAMLPALTYADNEKVYSLTVTVDELRNSTGIIQFSLYNKEGSIPDEKYEKYYVQKTGEIINGSSSIVFSNLPEGIYAVNILHDENSNRKIDKGFMLPIEGIGFSNFHSIGITNRPNFIKASFELFSNNEINIKIIYL